MTFRTLLPLLLLVCLGAVPGAAAIPEDSFAPDSLADTTVVEHWTLPNGLRVQTRHIPDALAVAITVGYAYGTDDDAAGREGLAQVASEAAFTSAAGEYPERIGDDLSSQRPLGASFTVSRRSTLFTEIARPEHFPGVLKEVATRMRGVQVSRAVLDRAMSDVRTEMSQQLFGPPQIALYHQVREVGMGRSDDELLRRASAKSLAKLGLKDVQQEIARVYVPANAALGIAGDLSRIDVHALVRNLFGDIPAGSAASHPPRPSLRPTSRVLRLEGLPTAGGAVGIIAPSLGDSLHPSFYLNTLILGSHLDSVWPRTGGDRSQRWFYAALDEPDLLRLFPPVDEKTQDADALGTKVAQALGLFSTMIVTTEPYEQVRSDTRWLLGGPMPPAIRGRAGRDPQILHTLARSMASRSLWGGESFWKAYRERFDRERAGNLGHWLDYFRDPQRQVRVLLLRRR